MATEHPQDNSYPWHTESTKTDKAPFVLKDSAPNPKAVTGPFGGPALAILIAWVFKCAGVDVPEEVVLAIAAVLGTVISYYTPARIN